MLKNIITHAGRHRNQVATNSSIRMCLARHFAAGSSTAPQKEEASTIVTIQQEEESDINGPMDLMKPSMIVQTLERHIVGQSDAKRAVAIALRNRWRRQQLHESVRSEVTPKNILMVGPTGCGKTEIARRLATLAGSPFIKVEATKFTEVGFHGRDVDMIIRDLIDASIRLVKEQKQNELRAQVLKQINEIILEKLLGTKKEDKRQVWAPLLEKGELEKETIAIEVPIKTPSGLPSIVGLGIEKGQGSFDISDLMKNFQGGKDKKETRKMPIAEARPILENMEMERLLESIDITAEAISLAEQSGIVFIDEIDKICSSGDYRGADASAEGVQRDLLPLIEGSTISTKHGNINTDHMLFVCSGAFHNCKPSDLLPELQGRLPIRVELQGLKEPELYKILTEPEVNLIKQQQMLIGTEGVDLEFDDDAIREIAKIAADMNHTVENIGARRLHTVMERIMEDISFEADEKVGETIIIDKALVKEQVGDMLKAQDLQKFIL
jgi:ATP-dependent HslUV protease ATP-binding subunit HslU